MIIIYHSNEKAIEAFDYDKKCIVTLNSNLTIQQNLIDLSLQFKNTFIGWCHIKLKENINFKEIPNILYHKKILFSYSTTKTFILNNNIGYVDSSPFVNVHFNNNYPTWLMSSDIGFTHSEVLQKLNHISFKKISFEEFLCYVAKSLMKIGLICKSIPKLLINDSFNEIQIKKNTSSNQILINFIKCNYKKRWLLLFFLNMLIYKKRCIFIKIIRSLFKKNINLGLIIISDIQINSTLDKTSIEKFSIDVLIPTLGRKKHLFNVLECLAKQTLLPKKVIIVEQNPIENSKTELDYLSNIWPFEIDHTFTHQTGACNARNIALSKIQSNWVFFADDDILFGKYFLEESFRQIRVLGEDCITFSCLQKNEKQEIELIYQWGTFASGASLVKSSQLKNIMFKKEHEFGYGEDADFGMQLRQQGSDIIFVPNIKLLHLKAPIGGFRHKHNFLWSKEKVQPKPSPTVMAFNLKYKTNEQLFGYKTILFLKYYKLQEIKNPIKYMNQMNIKWNKSIYWSKKIMDE